MDENSFVKYLKSEFPFTDGTGIGDDTSIIKRENGFQLITMDILIEGVHFNHSYFTPEEIAARALAVNLSDIAAMGGEPEYFFLGIGFPENFKGEKLERFFKELKNGCKNWNVKLAGGDMSSSPDKLFISITMVGNSSNPIRRDGAKAGDLIGISRVTGESSLGMELLKRGINIPYYSGLHKVPDPEIAKGVVFSEFVNSMIDVSDGLMIDLGRIMDSSNKGARIKYEKIPVTDEMKAICDKYELKETELVLAGGEDFSLLFTISPEKEKKMKKTAVEYHIIGDVIDEEGVIVEYQGKLLELRRKGFDHFE
ncbi:MAG: thiamine-phosphate kinase [Candidatus Aminicenantes bacterium]|nr:thiamine-phosphate kinase [Candidatus Aminicenantes bacterium]MCK5005452.1 thiamine-phosphate kinase [Candidatus Aminicenantes bacterium]